MPMTFGLTGMDPATESALKAAFADANARVGGHWQLLPETQAEYVVVDMDSMYGPMSWLRLHAAGKTVVGMTSAPRTQTDYRLAHPFDGHSVANLLKTIAGSTEQAPAEDDAPDDPSAEPALADDTTPVLSDNAPAGLTPAPQPQDSLPEEQPRAVDEESTPPPEPTAAVTGQDEPARAPTKEPPSAAAGQVVPPAPTIEPPAPPPEAELPEPRTLTEWLAAGRLTGRLRFERDGTVLLIDAAQRRYHGPTTLKPLAPHVTGEVSEDDFTELDEHAWASESAVLGEPMPLGRMVWFAALLGGQGTLAAGFDPDGRFRMLKWPQTEREYPKHFRIATVMMKGPATLEEIAAASGVPEANVTDFVNANLATGFADIEHPPEPEPEPPAKSGGLFGRLRKR